MVPLPLIQLCFIGRFVIMKPGLMVSNSADCQDSSEESRDPKDFVTKRVHYLFKDHFLSRILSF